MQSASAFKHHHLLMCMPLQARVLLLNADETYLWCPQPDACGDEDSETHIRFPCSPCITIAALHARQLLAVVDPASHPEYEETLDAASGEPIGMHCSVACYASSVEYAHWRCIMWAPTAMC